MRCACPFEVNRPPEISECGGGRIPKFLQEGRPAKDASPAAKSINRQED